MANFLKGTTIIFASFQDFLLGPKDYEAHMNALDVFFETVDKSFF